jgi:hypothetical protein
VVAGLEPAIAIAGGNALLTEIAVTGLRQSTWWRSRSAAMW